MAGFGARPDPGPGRLLRDARTRPQPARRRRLRPASPTTRPLRRGAKRPRAGRGDAIFVPFAFANRSPGRLTLGLVDGRLVAAEPRQSVIVVGPVQTGKTTGFAVPAILEWQGPVVATSVKTDLLRETIAARSAIPDAHVWVYDPTGGTGMPAAGLDAARGVHDLAGSAARRRMARLGRAPRRSGVENAEFWYAAAAKLLAPILFAAAVSERTMADVVRWVDAQSQEDVFDALEASERGGGSDGLPGVVAPRRPHPLGRLHDRRDRPRRLRRSGRARVGAQVRASSGSAARRRPPHRLPLRPVARAAPPAAALRDARPGDRRCGLRARDRDGRAGRPAAPPRARRVREHRAPARPRHPRLDRSRSGDPARLGLPGHGADQRGLRARPRADDRLEPPGEGDPLRNRRRPDARLRRRGCSATRRCARSPRRVRPKAGARRPSPSPSAASRRRTSSARCARATACSSTAIWLRRGSRSAPGSRIGGCDSWGRR